MSNQQTKVIALFVEGDTEIEFYKALISLFRNKNNVPFGCNFELKNLKGVGNYKKDALRYLNEIKRKNPDSNIYVFLCYDTDAFELSKNPPVNMKAVKKKLIENGACNVEFIEAKKSIEDWFLMDYEGVLDFLRLPSKTVKETGKGQAVLKKLFKKANKIYVKGGKTEGFIEHLDIDKIKNQICPLLRPLCKHIGLDCKRICNK